MLKDVKLVEALISLIVPISVSLLIVLFLIVPLAMEPALALLAQPDTL